MAELEGRTLGRYHLLHLLGQGGMAEVYLAHDDLLKRDVAVKVVSHSNSEYIARFKREAEAIGRLSHDHILPAFDYGDQDPWHFLVMPYVSHATLRERLLHGPLELHEAGEILAQIADALQFAHDHGIIHRDIKPSNILLRDPHYVYLADFGLAKSVRGTNELTLSGALLGTPEYMAPDLAQGPATKSSDIYALGVLLYQMLTGVVPFSGKTPLAIYMKHLHESPIPPSIMYPALPPALDAVVLHALEKDPYLRYPSVQALSVAYQQVLDELDATASSIVNADLYTTSYAEPAAIAGMNGILIEEEQAVSAEPTVPVTDAALDYKIASASVMSTPPIVAPRRRISRHRARTIIVSLIMLGVTLFVVLPMTLLYYLYATVGHSASGTTAIARSVSNTPSARSTAYAPTVVPLITDELSNNNAGRWAISATCTFQQGHYQVSSTQTNFLQLCPLLSPAPIDEKVQVDVSLLSGYDAGIVLYFSGSRFYSFEITKQGQFLFRRHDTTSGANYVDLIPPTSSTQIATNGQASTLTVLVHAGTFQLLINDVLVGEVHDATYSGGQIALSAGTLAPQTSGVATFSHFLLARLGP